MKLIETVPTNYDNLNNLSLRSAFEDEEDEPMLFTHLNPTGYVGHRPKDFVGEHEDDTWAIDQYDEYLIGVTESFLYTSEFEYNQDCEILGLI